MRNTNSIYREGAKSVRKILISCPVEKELSSSPKPAPLIGKPRRFGGSSVSVIVCFLISVVYLLSPAHSFAEDTISTSGKLSIRGVEELQKDSVPEDPGFSARIKFDAAVSSWRFHSWLEGGWDGAVTRPSRDNSLFKSFNEVYQDNTPYLEFKELYLEHSGEMLDIRAGIQRFAWGRLDEYPVNDLLNSWDYTQFLRKTLEDRKIGVPSLSGSVNADDWTVQAVWVPVLVPYRLSMPDERWSGVSAFNIPYAGVVPREAPRPEHTARNSNTGLRVSHTGELEWAVNLYHGYDPRPVFRTTSLSIAQTGSGLLIDPGYVPSFHRITSLGMDTAFVKGDWSIRAETAYAWNRFFNIRHELRGYPTVLAPGVYPLNPIEKESDTLDYGAGVDYRAFEDGLITLQGQQTVIFDRTDALYERKVESLFWINLKTAWMNQKIENNIALAYNPEHGALMARANVSYTLADAWKVLLSSVLLNGPPQSLFGRYARNDQMEAVVSFSW